MAAKKVGNISKRDLGWKYWAGVGTVAVSVAALFALRSCKPESEGIQKACPQVEPIVTPAPPVKGDGKCEIEKGEHDVFSNTYDPDCGYCGDLKQQPWENADQCPIDFACGDGKLDSKPVKYGGIVKTGEGEDTVYSYGIIEYSESCNSKAQNYCEADCSETKKPERIPGPLSQAEQKPAQAAVVTEEKPKPQKTGACPSPLGDGILSSRISSAITSSSGDIRGQAQGGGSAMSASVTVRIDGSGIPTIAGASVSCDGSQCPANVNPAAISRLTLQGIQVTGMQGTPCTKTYGARVR